MIAQAFAGTRNAAAGDTESASAIADMCKRLPHKFVQQVLWPTHTHTHTVYGQWRSNRNYDPYNLVRTACVAIVIGWSTQTLTRRLRHQSNSANTTRDHTHTHSLTYAYWTHTMNYRRQYPRGSVYPRRNCDHNRDTYYAYESHLPVYDVRASV